MSISDCLPPCFLLSFLRSLFNLPLHPSKGGCVEPRLEKHSLRQNFFKHCKNCEQHTSSALHSWKENTMKKITFKVERNKDKHKHKEKHRDKPIDKDHLHSWKAGSSCSVASLNTAHPGHSLLWNIFQVWTFSKYQQESFLQISKKKFVKKSSKIFSKSESFHKPHS